MFQRLRVDERHAYEAFNVKCHALMPGEGVSEAPFGASWVRVEPGQRTTLHAHLEREALFVTEGCANVTAMGRTTDVQKGDVIFLEGGTEHVVETTGDAALVLLSTYWLDPATPAALARLANVPARVLLTAAPPTPNGDLHIGHLSGPYLAADVLARFYRLAGADVRYVTGTDDNQSYVELAAKRAGETPIAYAAARAERIERGLAVANASPDVFVRPNASEDHRSMVLRLFTVLRDAGHIELRTENLPYCATCDKYLYEAFVEGRCPGCATTTCGNSCEPCGRPNDCHDLGSPRCTTCGTQADLAAYTRWVFPLTRYARFLEAFHRRLPGTGAHVRKLCFDLLSDGLSDVAISHPATWGIAVPDAACASQTFYVWFEMAARYLAYAQTLPGWPDPWRDENAAIVQCFGFDNAFFYALLIPAVMHAFDPTLRTPRAFVINEFYQLEGKKFSTSRKHAVWLLDLVEPETADVIRHFLCTTRPEPKPTDFSLPALLTASQALAARWEAYLKGMSERLDRFDRTAPVVGEWTQEDSAFVTSLLAAQNDIASDLHCDAFHPQRATAKLDDLLALTRDYAEAGVVWLRDAKYEAQARTVMALELAAVRALAVMASPIVPVFAQALYAALVNGGEVREARWPTELRWVAPGSRVGPLPLAILSTRCAALARRIDDLSLVTPEAQRRSL